MCSGRSPLLLDAHLRRLQRYIALLKACGHPVNAKASEYAPLQVTLNWLQERMEGKNDSLPYQDRGDEFSTST